MDPNILAKNLQKLARENPIKHIFVWSVKFWHKQFESLKFAFYVFLRLKRNCFEFCYLIFDREMKVLANIYDLIWLNMEKASEQLNI